MNNTRKAKLAALAIIPTLAVSALAGTAFAASGTTTTQTTMSSTSRPHDGTAMKAKLAADVASGKITQAQADQMITNMANHVGGPGKDHGKHGPRDNTQFSTDLAGVLGLNTTDVKAKLDAGTKPADIITATGKTEADVMAQLKTIRDTEMKTRLATDVASGKITQAQADAMIAHEATETQDGHHGGFKGIKTTTTSSTASTQ